MSKVEVYLVLWKTSTWPTYLPYNPTCNYSVLKQFFWAHGWTWDQFNALHFPCSCPCLYYASYSPVIRCQSLMNSFLYILTWWVSVLPRTRARVCLQPQLANLAFFCWMSWPPGCPCKHGKQDKEQQVYSHLSACVTFPKVCTPPWGLQPQKDLKPC